MTGESLGKWGLDGQRWGVDLTETTSQGSAFLAGPRRGSTHGSGGKASMSCFLTRKEQETAEQAPRSSLEGRKRLCRGSGRGAGKRQQGSDRKLLDLLRLAVLSLASWPACSSSMSVASFLTSARQPPP